MTNELTITPEEAALLLKYLYLSDSARGDIDALALIEKVKVHSALVPPELNGDKVWGGWTITHNQCGTCGAPASPVSLSRKYQGPLTETSRAGVTRNITVRELRALSRERVLNGGLCDRRELHGRPRVVGKPRRIKYSFLARYKKARP